MKKMKSAAAALLLAVCVAVLTGAPAKAMAAFTAADTAKTTMNLNLRSSMTTKEDNVLVVIPKGKIVDVLSGLEDGWYKVMYKTTTGYVSGKYLAKNTDKVTTTANLRLRSSMKTSTTDNILLVIPKGKSAPVISRYTNGWYKIKYKSKTGYVDGTYLDDPRLKKTSQKVTAVRVNLRSSRSTENNENIITVIPKGAKVTVVSTLDGGWTKITYNKKTGYVKSVYLKTASSTTETTTTRRETKYNVNLRSSMRTDITSNIIQLIPKNSVVTVLSQEDKNWYRVNYGGALGYVHVGYFK